jgi:O-succinylbenzoic acid--CoA ligase
LSHIALRRVSGSGATPWFTPLPGISLTTNEENCLVIDAPHLCPQVLTTHDVVELEQDTQRFKVLGRIDNVINTGGVKIQMEQVEQTLSPYIHRPFIITKCPDAKFGEIVVMLLQGTSTDVDEVEAVCRQHLPKRIITVDTIPLTPTGKPARQQAAHLAQQD